MKKLALPFLFLSAGLFLHSCTPELEGPEPQPGDADFSKVIAIGGNYMAGYQDGALFYDAQMRSIPALVNVQLQEVGAQAFNQILMPDNNGLGLSSKPWETWFVTPSHLNYRTDCNGVVSLGPIKTFMTVAEATPYLTGMAGNSNHNIAVPYANIASYFDPALGQPFSTTGNTNPYYNRIASTPGVSTMFSDAKEQQATFFMGWVGMEDIFNYASKGGTGAPIPSSASFGMYLDSLLDGLTANGAKGVLANIPDFRNFPYYTLVAWDNAKLDSTQVFSLNDALSSAGMPQIHFEVGRNGFVIEDAASTGGYRQLHSGEYLTLSVPIDSMKCNEYGLLVNVINDRYALDSNEIYEIDKAINEYNAVIAEEAAEYNLAMVDMHTFFASVTSGIQWDGVAFNATFVSGGFYSLDGYHPNQKGYVMLANEFIRAINSKYNSVIPWVNCSECHGILFP